MFKSNSMAALVAVALFATAGAASAQSLVQGGGASLPADLYKGQPDSILPSSFSYAVTGSGTGKSAFLTNTPGPFGTTGTVHFAGSDSVLSGTELSTYNATYNSPSVPATYVGPLLQLPSVATSVTIPFNKAGAALNLDVTQICGVFSGKLTDWSQVDSTRSGPIEVVYRAESSGTSELLSRFLATACLASDVAGTTLKLNAGGAPAFSVQSTFKNLFVGNTAPSNFVPAPATGGTPLYNHVNAQDGRVGYVGPDVIPSLTDATKVAKVKGYSPDEVSVTATLDTVAPPTGAAAADPANWVPVFGNPSAGYPIAGYTNLIFGQCYKVAAVVNAIRPFLNTHYTGGNDTAIRAHGFVPLNQAWKDAIRARFVLPSGDGAINKSGVCTGIGRG